MHNDFCWQVNTYIKSKFDFMINRKWENRNIILNHSINDNSDVCVNIRTLSTVFF